MRLLIVALSFCLLAGCDTSVHPTAEAEQPVTDRNEYDPAAPGGVGVSYSGKVGFDLGGGLILDADGGISPGFGL